VSASECRSPYPSGDYGCVASIVDSRAFPQSGKEVLLEAFVIPPEAASPERIASAQGLTNGEGRASLTLSAGVPFQRLSCRAFDVEATRPPIVTRSDPLAVPAGRLLRLARTAFAGLWTQGRFPGWKPGAAPATLYQSGPYDRPVVIPSPFDPNEQPGRRRSQGDLYHLFEPFIGVAQSQGLDVWLVKTATGQNIHEQAAEFAQAIDYAAAQAGPEATTAVAGYSLGGVTARLATARYEADPGWRRRLGVRDDLFANLVLFGDAPLAGAHISLPLQESVWDFFGKQADFNLNSCGAQQLLRLSYPGRDTLQPRDYNFRSFYVTGESPYFLRGKAQGYPYLCDHVGTNGWCTCDPEPPVFGVHGGGRAR